MDITLEGGKGNGGDGDEFAMIAAFSSHRAFCVLV
jgi:hypothetical protein